MTSISVPALLLVLELEDLELGLPVLLPDELLEPVELLPEPVELEPVVPEFVEDPDPWEASEPVEFEPEFPPVPELVLPLVSVPLLVRIRYSCCRSQYRWSRTNRWNQTNYRSWTTLRERSRSRSWCRCSSVYWCCPLACAGESMGTRFARAKAW